LPKLVRRWVQREAIGHRVQIRYRKKRHLEKKSKEGAAPDREERGAHRGKEERSLINRNRK